MRIVVSEMLSLVKEACPYMQGYAVPLHNPAASALVTPPAGVSMC